jgi:hypothetical protein
VMADTHPNLRCFSCGPKNAASLDCPVFETADGHRIFHGEAEIYPSNLPGTSTQPIPALQEPPGTTMFVQPLLQQKQYGVSDAYVDKGSRSIMSFPSVLAASNRRRQRSRVRHMVTNEPLSTTLPLDRSYVDALKVCIMPNNSGNILPALLWCYPFSFSCVDAYPERSYYGGPEHICPYCHAVFFGSKSVSKMIPAPPKGKLCTTFAAEEGK